MILLIDCGMLVSDAQIREYVCSERAYVLFQRSARWIVAFGIFLLLVIPASKLASVLRISSAFDGLLFCFMVAGCAAGLTIFFGMFAYLLLSDQSSERMFWAAVFLFTGWFGCTVYFFKIYRKHRLVDSVTGRVDDTPLYIHEGWPRPDGIAE